MAIVKPLSEGLLVPLSLLGSLSLPLSLSPSLSPSLSLSLSLSVLLDCLVQATILPGASCLVPRGQLPPWL